MQMLLAVLLAVTPQATVYQLERLPATFEGLLISNRGEVAGTVYQDNKSLPAIWRAGVLRHPEQRLTRQFTNGRCVEVPNRVQPQGVIHRIDGEGNAYGFIHAQTSRQGESYQQAAVWWRGTLYVIDSRNPGDRHYADGWEATFFHFNGHGQGAGTYMSARERRLLFSFDQRSEQVQFFRALDQFETPVRVLPNGTIITTYRKVSALGVELESIVKPRALWEERIVAADDKENILTTHRLRWQGEWKPLTNDPTSTRARSMNSRGLVVGAFRERATLWHDGHRVDLHEALPRGTKRSEAFDINDAGQIVILFDGGRAVLTP